MKFTKRNIDGIQPTGVRANYFDDNLKGFCLRVGISGEKVFYVVFRAGKGRSFPKRWLRLGRFPDMTVEQARELAKRKLAEVANGIDPTEQIRQDKVMLSVGDVLDLFVREHIQAHLKEKTVHEYSRLIEKIILPALGKLKIANVSVRHCAKLQHSLRDTPYQANRCMAVLSKFFSWCEKNGYRDQGSNPASSVDKFKESKRTTYMSTAELEAIGASIALLESTGKISLQSAAIFKLLLFTGARLGEILSLKWEYIDLEHGLAHLPDSKTGAKILHLPTYAKNVLENLPRMGEYCFCGTGRTGHIVEVKKPWKQIMTCAQLSGWRVHDLRHAFASYAVNSGKSLPLIGKLLGHSQASTTQRYAHVADNPVSQAAEETAALIMQDMARGARKQHVEAQLLQ